MSETLPAVLEPHPRRLRPYSAYRNSGVDWLGEAPAHWSILRLKYALARMLTGGTPDSGRAHYWSADDSGLPWVAIGDMTQSFRVASTAKRLTEQGFLSKRLSVVPAGTLLYSMYASLGKVALLDLDAVVNQAILGLVPRADRVIRDYLRWWLEFMQRHVPMLSSSNTQDNLNAEAVRNMPILLPPLSEQRTIAEFLDRETAKIDALAAKKQRVIELLQEKRAALITQAVTKGLDASAPKKDSGVEWLGAIPAHWSIERIKWVARMESGHTPDKKIAAYWQDGDIPWISLADSGQLRDVDYIADTTELTTSQGIANSSARILPPGTVVFSRDATVGLCAITSKSMAVSQHFIGWVCSERLQAEYLLFVLRSMTQELERLTMGATIRTIGMPDVRSLVTPVPPRREQQAIVEFVLSQRSRIDALVSKIDAGISRLKQFRIALISAAVTGKIDVREEAA